jgi:hypothetical protein
MQDRKKSRGGLLPAGNNGQSQYLPVRTAAEDSVVSSEILPPPIRGVNENHVVRLKLADAFTDHRRRVPTSPKKAVPSRSLFTLAL